MFMSPDKERLLHLSLYFNANILLVGNKKISLMIMWVSLEVGCHF